MSFERQEKEILHKRIKVAVYYFATPLVLLFSFVDLVFSPSNFLDFLVARLLVIPTCFIIFITIKVGIHKSKFDVMPVYLIVMYLSLYNTYMVAYSGLEHSSYYVGLLLITVGSTGFFPLSRGHTVVIIATNYLPYYLLMVFNIDSINFAVIYVNTSFIISVVFLSVVTAIISKNSRMREYEATIKEKTEKEGLEEYIKKKQDEAVLLSILGDNFPKETKKKIKEEPSLISKVRRRESLALFYDVVGSTTTSRRVDPYALQEELDYIILRCNEIYKSYGFVIGNYLGDGSLIIGNAPVDQEDYIYRSIQSSSEILNFV